MSLARFLIGTFIVGVIGLVLAELRKVVARSRLCNLDLLIAGDAGLLYAAGSG